MKIDGRRIIFFIISAIFGVAASYYGQPFVHGNSDAIGVIVNVFSILAGFLITVMTLSGEPSLLQGQTWRTDAIRGRNIYRRLTRYKFLFILYLTLLAIIFFATIFSKTNPESPITNWIERTYLFLATIAFILSLSLPQTLMKAQLRKHEEIVEARKTQNK